jgi:hypothetical protein
MAGRLTGAEDEILSSYGRRLRPRHFVLAWLSREGLCPTLVTTNYDLLIEGAYRLAGSKPRESPPGTHTEPTVAYGYFSRIAAAEDFFSRGAGHHAALIVKIHGCVDRYRKARKASEGWQEYLPAMVFTFREIQNWRQDAWSRDLLRTLVRTRTLAFAGYSGVDPVLHDTFRTVYEEMAQRRPAATPKTNSTSKTPEEAQNCASGDNLTSKTSEEAPTFFFGLADRQEFHPMEILRAASRAAGCQQDSLTGHPNFVPFHIPADDDRRFPNLDESMLWLFHLVFRQRQEQTLREGLRRTAWLLLGHPGAPADLKAIESRFKRLCDSERESALRWTEKATCRNQFSRMVGWTTRFHAGLLQEWALADKVARYQGPGFDLDGLRRSPWYQPASEHPEWTTWGVVLEIALRRAIASWRGDSERWAADSPWVRPGEEVRAPQVLFGHGPDAPTPLALTIRLTAFDRVRSLTREPTRLRSNVTWQLEPGDLPWRRNRLLSAGQPATPSAKDVWQWAGGTRHGVPAEFLGVVDG